MSQQIYELIPKVMAEVGAIEKGRKNQQQGYAFRGIDDVFAAFQGPLSKNGIFYVPEVLEEHRDEGQTKSGGTMYYTRLRIGYTFYAPDGSNVRAVVVGEAMDSADKSSNKAMSAALKYVLLQIFCVPTEANEDADSQTPEIQTKPKAVIGIDESLRTALNFFRITPDSASEAEFIMDALGLDMPCLMRNLAGNLKQELLTRLRQRASQKTKEAA